MQIRWQSALEIFEEGDSDNDEVDDATAPLKLLCKHVGCGTIGNPDAPVAVNHGADGGGVRHVRTYAR